MTPCIKVPYQDFSRLKEIFYSFFFLPMLDSDCCLPLATRPHSRVVFLDNFFFFSFDRIVVVPEPANPSVTFYFALVFGNTIQQDLGKWKAFTWCCLLVPKVVASSLQPLGHFLEESVFVDNIKVETGSTFPSIRGSHMHG